MYVLKIFCYLEFIPRFGKEKNVMNMIECAMYVIYLVKYTYII